MAIEVMLSWGALFGPLIVASVGIGVSTYRRRRSANANEVFFERQVKKGWRSWCSHAGDTDHTL